MKINLLIVCTVCRLCVHCFVNLVVCIDVDRMIGECLRATDHDQSEVARYGLGQRLAPYIQVPSTKIKVNLWFAVQILTHFLMLCN